MSVSTYFRNLGIETDVWLSVLTGGALGETISARVARGAANKSKAAQAVCWWLSLTVERDHCAKQGDGSATVPHAALLAAIQIVVAFALVVYLPLMIWRLVR